MKSIKDIKKKLKIVRRYLMKMKRERERDQLRTKKKKKKKKEKENAEPNGRRVKWRGG